jgi:transcriptional regulator with XRE-family HTH domain
MDLDNKTIARRIREIRGFDLSQKKFGQLLGVSQATVSKLEKGLVLPNSEILLRLSGISGKSIDWILKGEEKGK